MKKLGFGQFLIGTIEMWGPVYLAVSIGGAVFFAIKERDLEISILAALLFIACACVAFADYAKQVSKKKPA